MLSGERDHRKLRHLSAEERESRETVDGRVALAGQSAD